MLFPPGCPARGPPGSLSGDRAPLQSPYCIVLAWMLVSEIPSAGQPPPLLKTPQGSRCTGALATPRVRMGRKRYKALCLRLLDPGSSLPRRCLDSQTFHFPALLSCLALTGRRNERASLSQSQLKGGDITRTDPAPRNLGVAWGFCFSVPCTHYTSSLHSVLLPEPWHSHAEGLWLTFTHSYLSSYSGPGPV